MKHLLSIADLGRSGLEDLHLARPDALQKRLGLSEPGIAAVEGVDGAHSSASFLHHHRTKGLRTSRATRKPRFTFSSLPSKTRSSCSMMMGPS